MSDASTAIEMQQISMSYRNRVVLRDVTLRIPRGAFIGLVGANGSGKTTLLRVVSKLLPRVSGVITIEGRDLDSYSRRDLARVVAAVWQRPPLTFGFTARQLVLLGRTPHLPLLKWESAHDEEIASEAMRLTETIGLAERPAAELSAGELQRVFIATALAQESRILLLDEPTTFLDLRQLARLSSLLDRLHADGITIICASHDLAFLRRHTNGIILTSGGTTSPVLPPDQALSAQSIHDLFGLDESGLAEPRSDHV